MVRADDFAAGPVRALRDADIPALIALFQRCYGDSYGSRLFYDAGALRSALQTGALRSVVIDAPDGALLGHTAITVRDTQARVCETGNTVVDPSARGRGLLRLLGNGLKQRVLADGFAGYVHYPTTAHEIMQRTSVAHGGTEVGVMLGYIAATTRYAAVDRSAGRLAATVVYQPFGALPVRRVHVPQRYRVLIDELYRAAGLTRHSTAATAQPAAHRSLLRPLWNPSRGLLRLVVERAGFDLAAQVADAIAQHDPVVAHLDMTLDQPGLDAAVEALVPLGFLFCALLPEFAHTDVLRLQALRDRTGGVFRPSVVNPGAAALCGLIRAEAGLRG